jgi:hypothetical protein
MNRYSARLLLGSGIIACAAQHSPGPPAQAPLPEPTVPAIPRNIPQRSGPWNFRYTPGVMKYEIARNAAVQNMDVIADSIRSSTTRSDDSLIFETSDSGTSVKAVVISATAGQSEAANSAEISALLGDSTLTINTVTTETCTPANSVLTADLYNLIVPFPARLVPGYAWKDSIEMNLCQTGVPISAKISRSFLVRGDTLYQDKHLVMIARTDSVTMEGAGGLEQHRLTVHAMGTGTAVYYLNPDSSSTVVRLTVKQNIGFELITVEDRSHFTQTLTQEFVLLP